MPDAECCEFCKNPVNIKLPGNFVFVEGWEKVRRAGEGGGHGLTRRKAMGKYACRECMDKLDRGINIDQGEMF